MFTRVQVEKTVKRILKGTLDADTALLGADLIGLTLSGLDFSCIILRGADLNFVSLGTILPGMPVREVTLMKSLKETGVAQEIIPGADLTNADLRGASLVDAWLSGANFSGALLRGAVLIGADGGSGERMISQKKYGPFTGVDLSYADLRGATFFKANLVEANLSRANLTGAYLHSANLMGADLSGAILIGADLSNANLTKAKLTGAEISGNPFSERRPKHWSGDKTVKSRFFEGADLSQANLRGVHLSGVNLIGVKLRRAYLADVNLNTANLSEANLEGANLSHACLFSANLYGANLNQANLSEADLVLTHLPGADLRGANLSGADLTEAIISGANLDGANLSEANLKGICFDENTILPSNIHLSRSKRKGGRNPLQSTIWARNEVGDRSRDDPIHDKYVIKEWYRRYLEEHNNKELEDPRTSYFKAVYPSTKDKHIV